MAGSPMAGNGDVAGRSPGSASTSTRQPRHAGRYFYDADGEFADRAAAGRLHIATELGVLEVEPQEIAVIPRGIRFPRRTARRPFARLCSAEELRRVHAHPDLGPIGSNGLANPRDFPRMRVCEGRRRVSLELIAKFRGHLWVARRSAIRRSMSSGGTAATCRTSTTCACSTPSVRSATTIRIRRSSWC